MSQKKKEEIKNKVIYKINSSCDLIDMINFLRFLKLRNNCNYVAVKNLSKGVSEEYSKRV